MTVRWTVRAANDRARRRKSSPVSRTILSVHKEFDLWILNFFCWKQNLKCIFVMYGTDCRKSVKRRATALFSNKEYTKWLELDFVAEFFHVVCKTCEKKLCFHFSSCQKPFEAKIPFDYADRALPWIDIGSFWVKEAATGQPFAGCPVDFFFL